MKKAPYLLLCVCLGLSLKILGKYSMEGFRFDAKGSFKEDAKVVINFSSSSQNVHAFSL